MNTLRYLKGNFLIAGVGVGMGIASKKIFHREVVPVSSTRQILFTFSGITIATIVGKMIMLKLSKEKKLGFDKAPNEGFIGPYSSGNIFFGPEDWEDPPKRHPHQKWAIDKLKMERSTIKKPTNVAKYILGYNWEKIRIQAV